MSAKPVLPKSASVAHQGEGARLHAPAAERNTDAITDLLLHYAPKAGSALEIASGTGQHIARFAAEMPGLQWVPSDIAPDRVASIDAWVGEASVGNVAPAMLLDASQPGWANTHKELDLIVLINLLHLIPWDAVEIILQEISRALNPQGRFVLYGPFMRSGELTSQGDFRFHTTLQEADPAIGYKDDFDVIDALHATGLSLCDVVEMPANNLALIAEQHG